MSNMQPSQIQKTTDYNLFHFLDCNRNIDQGLVRTLVKSISNHNLLHYRPISVNANMQVIDGQHRLMAAKNLGLEIYYQITHEMKEVDLIAINNATKLWVAEDYIKYFASKGVTAYRELQELMQQWGCSSTHVISFLGLTERVKDKFKKGEFKFNKNEVSETRQFYLDTVQVIKKLRPCSERLFIKNTYFSKALSAFSKLEGVDKTVFLDKLEIKMNFLRSCSNVKDYLIMLQEIYNFRNRTPIELTFGKGGRVEQYQYEDAL